LAQQGSSDTALEASLVAGEGDADDAAEAQQYLDELVPPTLEVTRWATAVASHVPRMRKWWRCVAGTLTDTPAAATTRRGGLATMLGAVVGASTAEEQSSLVSELQLW